MRPFREAEHAYMRSTATTVIATAALVLFGCTVGLLMGRWMTSPPPAAHEESRALAPQIDLSPLLAEIQETREVLLRSQGGQETTRSGISASGESGAPRSDELERLTLAIERLSDLLEASGTLNGRRSRAMEQMKSPGFPSLAAIWDRAAELRQTRGNAWFEELRVELTKAHLAWLRDEVLERYGTPDALGAVDGALNVVYKQDPRPGIASPTIVFVTSDNIVTTVYSSP